MSSHKAKIHIDGGSRGNPGPASFAYVIDMTEGTIEHAEPIGKKTNNIAEYTALVQALKKAKELQLQQIEIFSDSELLVKQMTGVYRVKNEDLQEMVDQANAVMQEIKSVKLQHVKREFNKQADALCNEALDINQSITRDSRSGVSETAHAISPEEYLGMMGEEWIRKGKLIPPPTEVLIQLRKLLQE